MARQSKEKADYFPHMATATTGKTLYVIESEYGNDGYAFWFKLLESLCQAEGHYIRLGSAADLRYLSARARVASETSVAILDLLAELEAIDPVLWHEERTVWCQNLVNNLEPLYQRRTGGLPKRPGSDSQSLPLPAMEAPEKEEGNLPAETPASPVSVDMMQTENPSGVISVDILHTETPLNADSADRNPQSKVKESKEIVKEILKPLVPPPGDAPPKSAKTSRIFGPATFEYKMAQYLLDKIRVLDPKAKQPNLQLWAMDIDRLIRIDKRTPAEVKDLIDFAHDDPFWCKQILSPGNLRNKATKLTVLMKNTPTQGGTGYGVTAKPGGKSAETSADPRFAASRYGAKGS